MGKGAEATAMMKLRLTGQNGGDKASLPGVKVDEEIPSEIPKETSGKEVKEEKSPEQSAGFISMIFFLWMNPLVRKGFKMPLEQEDLPRLMDKDDVKHVSTRFAKQWSKEVDSRPSPSLTRALFTVFANRLIVGAILTFISNILQLLPSILLNTILLYIEKKPSNNFMYQMFGRHYGYYSAVGLLLVLTLKTVFETQYQQVMFRLEIHVRQYRFFAMPSSKCLSALQVRPRGMPVHGLGVHCTVHTFNTPNRSGVWDECGEWRDCAVREQADPLRSSRGYC